MIGDMIRMHPSQSVGFVTISTQNINTQLRNTNPTAKHYTKPNILDKDPKHYTKPSKKQAKPKNIRQNQKH